VIIHISSACSHILAPRSSCILLNINESTFTFRRISFFFFFVLPFTTLPVIRLHSFQWQGDSSIKNWKLSKSRNRELTEALCRHIWRDWGNSRKSLVRIVDVPAGIGTDQLLNTSLECYFYNNRIGKVCFSYSSLFFYLPSFIYLFFSYVLSFFVYFFFIDFFLSVISFQCIFFYSRSYFIFSFLHFFKSLFVLLFLSFFFQERSRILWKRNLRAV
jgi:hypothetical protein